MDDLTWNGGADDSNVYFDHRPYIDRCSVVERILRFSENSDSVQSNDAMSVSKSDVDLKCLNTNLARQDRAPTPKMAIKTILSLFGRLI
jgi:hypothetical protein